MSSFIVGMLVTIITSVFFAFLGAPIWATVGFSVVLGVLASKD